MPLIEIGPYLLPNVAAAGPGRQLDRVKTIVRSMTAPEGTFSYDFRRQLSGVEAPEAVRVDMLQDHTGRPCVIECEAVEPSLFFRHGRHAALALADALESEVTNRSS